MLIRNSRARKLALVTLIGSLILLAAIALDYCLNSSSASLDSSDNNSITFNFNIGTIKGIIKLDF